ncbi:MAG: acetate--CoA ligase family protein [Anaerolineaceae bacterium]|jgi:acetyltransferase|nr:acetate--CoA ligase family protein [Anaerolineaceae bacterium]
MENSLKPFFDADGVAIIGATNKPNKLSYGIVKNLSLYGFKGGIYPVNPKVDNILGFRCYPDILSVPDPVDLAVIVLPAGIILPVIQDCEKRGIKAITVISGGFKELGPEGEALEKKILQFVKEHNMRMVGPNCVGTMSLHTGLNTTFISGVPDTGGIGFLSQSGAVLGGVVDYVRGKGIGFSHFLSLGNEADVTETDMIEYLADDPHTSVIAAYVEQIRDGQKFITAAKKVTKKKPIVLLKAGKTSAGARAVSSHTGSLAGSHAAYQAAFVQSGVVEVQTVNDLFEVTQAFALQKPPQGNRVAILTNSGGPAALLSDSLANNGFVMADLEAATMHAISAILNPSAQVANPVDMLGGAEPHEYEQTMQLLVDDPNVDVVIPILVPQALVNPVDVAEKISQIAGGTEKTVIAVFMGDSLVLEPRKLLHHRKVPMVVFPESVGTILGAMQVYANWLKKPVEEPAIVHTVKKSLAKEIIDQAMHLGSMGEVLTRPLLEAYGIPLIPADVALSVEDAVQVANQIGYPVVMKINSPDILHKSDVGGIQLGLNDAESVRQAFQEMISQIREKMPKARIEGVLIEALAPKGQEVIIGMKRDPGFGPMMMFGLGGIFVELFKDVSFRVAPLTRSDAYDMIQTTRAAKLLTGYRGQKPADLDAVVDTILRLSQLAVDFEEIEEIEINPLLVLENGCLALDGRVILKQ